jgi:hypothetical protein
MECSNPSGSELMKSSRLTCSAASSTALGTDPARHAELAPQLLRIELAHVAAAHPDGAFLRVVEAQQQRPSPRTMKRAGCTPVIPEKT